ncbi:Prolactin regulatory element-binding protein [Aphelenchoides besseyi]|nr:Prolactin regulatory element-binding protein [Aphelenchoides besseyi]
MGVSTSKNPTKLATCPMPVFTVKNLGPRHVLVAGGGGAAKTGVSNQIRIYLLTYNPHHESGPQTTDKLPPLLGIPVSKTDTSTAAVMNADVICLEGDERFLVATGEDADCALYVTTNYSLQPPIHDKDDQDGKTAPTPRLALNLKEVLRFPTDESNVDPYQKCVRFHRTETHKILLGTGGQDGHLRVWDVSDVAEGRIRSNGDRKPTLIQEFNLDGGCVDDADFSVDGTVLAAVTDKWVGLLSLKNSRSMFPLPSPGQIPSEKFKVRSIRFTNLGNQTYFAVAYQQRNKRGKQTSFVALWRFNGERFSLANARAIKDVSISCIAVSPKRSEFLACGTLEGNVYCLETGNLDIVYQSVASNGVFITSIDFLPLGQEIKHPRQPSKFLPGPGADAMASIVALSVDQHIQLHSVPFPQSTSFSRTLLKLGLQLLAVYTVAYLLFLY